MGSEAFASRLARLRRVSIATTCRISHGGLRGPAQGAVADSRVALTCSAIRPWLQSGTGLSRTAETALLVLMGCFGLALGLLVYLTDRDALHAALIPAVPALAGGNLFGAFGQWLPSFAHPFAFSLFTAAAHRSSASPAYWACAMWCAVNVAFEAAQYPGTSLAIAESLEGGLGRSWLTYSLSNYVLRGTFDVGDLVAAALGALAAAGTLYVVHRVGVTHDQ